MAAPTDGAPSFVPLAASPVLVGRGEGAALRLAHPSVSRRHATLRASAGGLAVEDHDSRTGTYLNGARIRAASARPGDRLRFGSAAPYRVEAGGLRLDASGGGMGLSAVALTLWAPGAGDRRGETRRGPRPLVRDVDFPVRPEAFVGILGPSGAGKSTLLHCLASHLPPGRGRLLFDDGRDAYAEADDYRAMIGHVPQDDVLFRLLSARENLAHAARLRLGPGASRAARASAVEEALERVGLARHGDTPAGSLSGGRRKRLGVAIELLRRPRLLLLDEPTSGLDPAGEAHLMEQLRLLARRGTTVVCATHLMENVRLFDEVIVLGVDGVEGGPDAAGAGRLAYAGPPDGLLDRFGCRHHADLYEALAGGRFEPLAARGPGDAGAGRGPEGTGTPPAPAAPGARTEPGAGWRQAAAVAGRAARLLARDRGLLAATLAQPVALGLMVGLTQYYAASADPVLFFAIVVAIWLGLNHSARDLVRERRHYVRDRLAGLRPDAYLAGKAAVHAAVGAVQVLALLATLRAAAAVCPAYPATAKALAEAWGPRLLAAAMMAYLGGVGLGLLASALARTEEAAVAALPLLILPQILLSAVATQTAAVPYEGDRPFRPLAATIASPGRPPWQQLTVDALSLACVSRPAALVAERPAVDGLGPRIWLADLCHLAILLLGTWAALFVTFHRAERRWLRLIGLG
jgi:ABC transport system ATP-binding/permease protein